MAISTMKRSTSTGGVRASCYAVNTSTGALQGFQYTTATFGAGPPLYATTTHASAKLGGGRAARRGGAAYTIAGECERLFCGTLRAVFLGEGNRLRQDSLVMDVYNGGIDHSVKGAELLDGSRGFVSDWIEMWDYVGGIQFRGFVADKGDERAMFVFFDDSVVAGDLKAGLMALLELCEVDSFSCDRLVVCMDRHADRIARDTLVKDLGWIGFSLTTLEEFTDTGDLTSDEWLFMDMET
ncbi:ornithine decarboxylase antizyme-domain-containing protein [Phaeosphaeriaceae sp. PMI808]|nr:ornithine decarboxylase antizyme-domain-containing protein [Phaeosphaeriaceae sp. PMI808]